MYLIKKKFSYKKSIKISNTRLELNSVRESMNIQNFHNIVSVNTNLRNYFFSNYFLINQKREVANCVLKDMIHLIKMWRQIRGYPQGGNTTHTNSNTSKKNKLLLNFRLDQFYKLFGQKKRNIYPTLIKAEYNNRLWFYNWTLEWVQASYKALYMAHFGLKIGEFNPVLLANNRANNYTRTGKASKMSKAKVIKKTFTIGVPLFFTRYIYDTFTPKDFPKILLKDEVNKKLGKKLKRSQYRKKKC